MKGRWILITLAIRGIVSEGNRQADVKQLYAIPRYQDHWRPSHQLQASFEENSSMESTHNVQAHFTIDAVHPSINLDNYREIVGINCSLPDSLLVFFDSEESIIDAFTSWNGQENLVFWLNPKHNCVGQKIVQAFQLIHIQYTNMINKSMIMDVKILDHADVFGSYELDAGLVIKKDLSEFNKSLAFNMNMNYKDGAVQNPNIVLLTEKHRMAANCSNCFLSGSLNWRLYLRSKGAHVEEYKLSFSGEYKANIDLNIVFAKHPDDDNVIRVSILSFPLMNPFTVPGIISFGPAIDLDTAFSYALYQPFFLSFGFDYDHPFEYVIHSERGLTAVPNVTQSGAPSKHIHDLTHSINSSADLGLHLIPTLGFKLELVHIRVFELALSFDNWVGVQIRQGAETICKDPSVKKEYQMYHQHVFAFDIITIPLGWKKRWSFIDSGKKFFKCPFCTTSLNDCKNKTLNSV